MANKIQHKRTSTAGNAPTAAQIEIGELALNFPDRQCYTRDGGGNIIELTKFRHQTNGESNARRVRFGQHSDPVTTVDINGNYAQNAVVATAGAVNCALSNYFTLTIAAATSITFTNVPTGRAYSCTIEVTHTAGSLAWPPAVKWAGGGTAPSLTAAKASIFMLVTSDGGTTWYATSLVDY